MHVKARLVVRKEKNAREALDELNKQLFKTLGMPVKCQWSFPDGSRANLPTWCKRVKGGYLTIGFRPEFKWSSQTNASKYRCPILIALAKATSGMSPLVEVNIPEVADGRVNGCFALDEDRQLWLCHRGNKLTVNQNDRITKKAIHSHFRGWLEPAVDGKSFVKIIPVVALNSKRSKLDLAEFARKVETLKARYR